ncbi:MAG: hypothetical protein U9M98_03030 [Patescibacteria group bacterium]|nr:hypothetical protein [Patescibacteria group bacterium]
MISKTLLKLIDEAILPAVVVIAGKVLGVAILSIHINVPFTLDLGTLAEHHAATINKYSNLFSYSAVTLGMVFILIRSYLFHTTHISPKITLRLYDLNLTSLIETTYELFHQAVVWLSYQWLLTILFLLQSYWNLVSWEYSLAILFVTLIFTSIFIIDVDREIKIAKS